MKTFNNQLKIFVAGFLVLAFMVILLRWGRTYCQYDGGFSPPIKNFGFTLKNFIKEFDDNPGTNGFPFEVVIKRDALSNLSTLPYLRTCISGTVWEELKVKDLYSPSLWDRTSKNLVYFNESLGLVVHSRAFKESIDNKSWWGEEVLSYAGPEGISKTPDPNIGRFCRPVRQISMDSMILIFDKELRRFYDINFYKKTVTKSPQMDKDKEYLRPAQFGGGPLCSIYMQWPSSVPEPIKKKFHPWFATDPVTLVVDQTGRIDRFDYQAMKIIGKAGCLPALPRHLLEYTFIPFFMGNEYKGLAVASLNQELVLVLSVFDAEGNLIKNDGLQLNSWKVSGYGGMWAAANYLLENLHPPILDVATYFTADWFSAAESQTGIFLLPNSLVGSLSRHMVDNHWLQRLTVPFLAMFPTIILVIFLAIKINKDAKFIGLPFEARRVWIIGTLAFGLVAYITWRITRPSIVMVTCQNCGKLRRPDFENCQRCGSGWHVPELIPPAWRVMDAEGCDSVVEEKVNVSN